MLIDERTYERLQRRNQEALTNAENIATIIKEQIIAPACQDGITDFTLMGVIQEEIMPLVQDKGWFLDTEMLYIVQKKGYKFKEIPINWVENGKSGVKLFKTVKDFILN